MDLNISAILLDDPFDCEFEAVPVVEEDRVNQEMAVYRLPFCRVNEHVSGSNVSAPDVHKAVKSVGAEGDGLVPIVARRKQPIALLGPR
jgi:hypothetical protein